MHGIIISHRDRNRFLRWCLASITLSEEVTEISDYHVFVVDGGSAEEPPVPSRGSVLHDRHHGFWFNKAKLLNLGIDAALACGASVLTFLDADAIVGPLWLAGVECLATLRLTLLTYRVRYLGEKHFACLEPYWDKFSDMRRLAINGLFRQYDAKEFEGLDLPKDLTDLLRERPDRFPKCGEIYGSPDDIYRGNKSSPPVGPHVFGNSQISIHAHKLDKLRYNEDFEGRGWEDQWFLRALWRREGSRYFAAMLTEPERAMFHIHLPVATSDDAPWDNEKALKRNEALYRST